MNEKVRCFKAITTGMKVIAISRFKSELNNYMQINRKLTKEDYVVKESRVILESEKYLKMIPLSKKYGIPLIDHFIILEEKDKLIMKVFSETKIKSIDSSMLNCIDFSNLTKDQFNWLMKITNDGKIVAGNFIPFLHPILYCDLDNYIDYRHNVILNHGCPDNIIDEYKKLIESK